MLKDLFQKKKKYATITLYQSKNKTSYDMEYKTNNSEDKKEKIEIKLDENIWARCGECEEIVLKKDIADNFNICTKCNHHFRIGGKERINLIIDEGTFVEYDKDMSSANPIDFPEYEEKIDKAKAQSNLEDAVITGEGKIKDNPCVICVMDSKFMMGSMGSVVGEKITRAIEKAIEKRLPVIIFSASGGARMQEGILSLMQMAKTSAALGKLGEEGLPYISVLTDPTTGGVTASFAMLGDIIISEPKALIGFAGPRVIEQTIRQKLPDGFQKAEFLQEKGFVDKIVHRKDMKDTLANILFIHSLGGEGVE
ncbi:acetyl-coenzyme A carboxylase carboxyl transferase subunit beta/alpha [Gottschalkia purinilytica]|uniref:Acetyl-coenzyme A carboxylase carboxyl transferase subunit beta n=1 Tax=Gottschalkia purinilytica TaxID=1503 RepID=A0A0L0W8B7_GOTPU|nr:acetyl-CoA carboxylase, carboxyltransferase subunit beta [Gottschalkia purinilytica]KNF07794.1 acetyl-coenzyme A carboxylase carboxyl transferase subunit beta/alpha [Gottschalkia purinilytica]